MAESYQKLTIAVQGMSCSSCELKIENRLKKQDGIKTAHVSLAKSNTVLEYNPQMISIAEIIRIIEDLGYEAQVALENEKKASHSGKFSFNQLLGLGIVVFALYYVINSTVGFNFIPSVDQSASYGMLFVVGLLTSLHCIAMCGGINISQSLQAGENNSGGSAFEKLRPSLLYNAGRVVSYTIMGGIVGALGSVISFSGPAKGVVAVIAGLFMVVIGINMLDVFPWLKRFSLRMPKFFGNKVLNNSGKHGPFIVGLFNGLMPCGPLQTMQLYALGTGSFWTGALSMFLFSLGTVPLMFGFGAISSILSKKFTHRMLKASAILVIVLGLLMMTRGLSLSGVSVASAVPIDSKTVNVAKIENGVQVVTTTMESGRYTPFVVQKGIPVRWTIEAKAEDLNGCNNPVTIPKYNIQKQLVPGKNVIEFTPTEEGSITYTCWMGMISSTIKVVSDIGNVTDKDVSGLDSGAGQSLGGSCCSTGAQATRFAGGRIPTDDLQVARIVNGVQQVEITVNNQGFSPAAVVLQRGVKVKIRFKPEQLNSCNNVILFPEYQGQLNLSQGQLESPEFTADQDFTFRCWMGMLNGYVKVVDDIKNVDLNQVKAEIEAYRPSGGGGCCGG